MHASTTKLLTPEIGAYNLVMTKQHTGEIGWRPDVYPETEQDKATAARQDARFERAMRKGEVEVIEEVSLDDIGLDEE